MRHDPHVQALAAIIIAIGALLGVYTGARYAWERLSEQLAEERRLAEERLDAEAERLQMQLDAESERLQLQLDAAARRLDEQLSAERQRQDRSELRGVLAEGAGLLVVRWDHVWAIRGEWEAMRRDDRERPLPGFLLDSANDADEVDNEELTRYWQSLLLVFEPEDEIATAIKEADSAFRRARIVSRKPSDELDSHDWDKFIEIAEEFDSAHGKFLMECKQRFGPSGN